MSLSRFLATTTVAVAIAGCAEHPVAPESPAIAMKRAATAAEVPITCEVTWMSPVTGSWADASKWSTGAVPTAADNVCISVDGTYTVRLQSSATVSSIMVGQPGNTGVQTLVVEAFNATTTLTATGDVINHGDIALAWNRGTNGQAAILASTGGTVFNHGLLRTVPDAIGAPRVLAANLLAIGEGSEGAGSFTVRGASSLEGDIAAAQHVTVEAFNANASLTSATAFTNAGHINLQWNRGTNGHAAILAVTEGVLTNTGVIQAFTDAIAAPRVIAASITNADGGSVIIGTATTFLRVAVVMSAVQVNPGRTSGTSSSSVITTLKFVACCVFA